MKASLLPRMLTPSPIKLPAELVTAIQAGVGIRIVGLLEEPDVWQQAAQRALLTHYSEADEIYDALV